MGAGHCVSGGSGDGGKYCEKCARKMTVHFRDGTENVINVVDLGYFGCGVFGSDHIQCRCGRVYRTDYETAKKIHSIKCLQKSYCSKHDNGFSLVRIAT
jgi:hypothetical protein